MAKLSSRTELSTPTLASRFHTIKQIAGVWYSYWVSFETLKDFIATYIFGFKITKVTFLDHDVSYEYQAAQYEYVDKIIMKGASAGDTISVIDVFANSLCDETTVKINSIGYYSEDPDAADRILTITPSVDCTLVIISIPNL